MGLYNLASFILVLGVLYFHYEYGMNILYTIFFIGFAVILTTVSKPNRENWKLMQSEIELNKARTEYYKKYSKEKKR